jgi:hypothetical protein
VDCQETPSETLPTGRGGDFLLELGCRPSRFAQQWIMLQDEKPPRRLFTEVEHSLAIAVARNEGATDSAADENGGQDFQVDDDQPNRDESHCHAVDPHESPATRVVVLLW